VAGDKSVWPGDRLTRIVGATSRSKGSDVIRQHNPGSLLSRAVPACAERWYLGRRERLTT